MALARTTRGAFEPDAARH